MIKILNNANNFAFPVMENKFLNGMWNMTKKPYFSGLQHNPRKSLKKIKNFLNLNIVYNDTNNWKIVNHLITNFKHGTASHCGNYF